MVRYVDDVSLVFEAALDDSGWLVLETEGGASRRLRRVTAREFDRGMRSSRWLPFRAGEVGVSVLWLFRAHYLWDDGNKLSAADIYSEVERRALNGWVDGRPKLRILSSQ
jgi:hypothetical protein